MNKCEKEKEIIFALNRIDSKNIFLMWFFCIKYEKYFLNSYSFASILYIYIILFYWIRVQILHIYLLLKFLFRIHIHIFWKIVCDVVYLATTITLHHSNVIQWHIIFNEVVKAFIYKNLESIFFVFGKIQNNSIISIMCCVWC